MRPRRKIQARSTIKVPKALHERINALIAGGQFSSVTDFVVFVLRDLVSQSDRAQKAPGGAEIDETRRKLRNLGYL